MSEKISYRIAEAVTVTGVSRTALYRALKAGELAAIKRGATTLIAADELRRWIGALPKAA